MIPILVFALGLAVNIAVITHALFLCAQETATESKRHCAQNHDGLAGILRHARQMSASAALISREIHSASGLSQIGPRLDCSLPMIPILVFAFGLAVNIAVTTHVLFLCAQEKTVVPVYYTPSQDAALAPAATTSTSAQQGDQKIVVRPTPGQVNRAPQVVYVQPYYRGHCYDGYYERSIQQAVGPRLDCSLPMIPILAFAFGLAVNIAVITHVLFLCAQEKTVIPVYYTPSQNAAQAPATSASAQQGDQKMVVRPTPGQVNRAPQVVYVQPYYRGHCYDGYYGGGWGGCYGYGWGGGCYSPCYTSSCCW
uniref:G_PROTEIN_RECEP_F1_2 domain-containing protein n=1 Tax=Steinernema glaseri TaxID=37863 RepID=A0A1I7YDC1_9BILA